MSIDLTQATIAIALFYTYGSINKAISTSIDLTQATMAIASTIYLLQCKRPISWHLAGTHHRTTPMKRFLFLLPFIIHHQSLSLSSILIFFFFCRCLLCSMLLMYAFVCCCCCSWFCFFVFFVMFNYYDEAKALLGLLSHYYTDRHYLLVVDCFNELT